MVKKKLYYCFFIHDVFVFKASKDPINLLKRLLQLQDISHIPAIKWGIEKEDIVRSAYVAKVSVLHQSFECKSSGLVVNCRYPHLDASPDGLVNCDCCFGEGIL